MTDRNTFPFIIITVTLIGILKPEYYLIFVSAVIFYFFVLKKLKIETLKPIIPPFVLLFICAGLFSFNHDNYETLKGYWYLLKFAALMLIGFIIGAKVNRSNKQNSFLVGSAIAAFFLSMAEIFDYHFDAYQGAGRTVSFFSAFIFPFYLRNVRSGILSGNYSKLLVFIPLAYSLYVSESRTAVVVFIISLVAAFGNLRQAKRFSAVCLVLVVGAYVVIPYLPQYDIHEVTFLGKVQNSLNEIALERGDTDLSMYANWRGFEAYRALETFSEYSSLEKIFGGGSGATVDLGRYIHYAGEQTTELDFVHNGFFTVLVKYGVLGLLAFCYILLLPWLSSKRKLRNFDPVHIDLARAASVVLLVTTVSVSGPLNRSLLDGVLVIFGFALAGKWNSAQHSIRTTSSLAPMPSTRDQKRPGLGS